MQTVRLGPEGLQVSAMGLGCMGMSEFYGPTDRDQSLATLHRAADLGVTLFDTADVYGLGANERLLGEFLRGQLREEVLIATKFGGIRDPETGRPVPPGVRGDATYVRSACEQSLRRLGTDHIDLYYQHLPDPRTPIEETVGALSELVVAGKVRHVGLSNLRHDQLRAANAVHPITAVQGEWSLFTRDVEECLMPTCAELGVGFVAYSPLGRGFLTGAPTAAAGLAEDDFRRVIPRFQPGRSEHNTGLLVPVRKIAEQYGTSLAQVALAWLLHQQDLHGLPVVPIPGSCRADHLAENLAASGIRLSTDDLAELEPIASRVVGSNNPPPPPEFAHLLDTR